MKKNIINVMNEVHIDVVDGKVKLMSKSLEEIEPE